MNKEDLLKNIKWNLGLKTSVIDEYLNRLIEGAISQLKMKRIDPEGQSEEYQKEYYYFLEDFVAWSYRTRGGEVVLPPYLRLRMNNLIVGYQDV